MSIAHINALFRHMWWADEHALASVMAADPRPARAVELYVHVVGAELVWLDRVEGAAGGGVGDGAGNRRLLRTARRSARPHGGATPRCSARSARPISIV